MATAIWIFRGLDHSLFSHTMMNFVVVVVVVVYSLNQVWLLCDPMDYSPAGSSVLGISQGITVEWVAISFSRGFFQCRDQTYVSWVSCIGRLILYHWAIRKPQWWCFKLNKIDISRLCNSDDLWTSSPEFKSQKGLTASNWRQENPPV